MSVGRNGVHELVYVDLGDSQALTGNTHLE